MSKEAIDALKHIFDYAEREAGIARQQGDYSKAARDYRDSDRHHSYASAMEKVRAKAMAYAREHFLADVSGKVAAMRSETNNEKGTE
jgi:hypothetical protein